MYCTHCGHRNPAGANFCAHCGRPQSTTGDQTTGTLSTETEPAEIAEARVDSEERLIQELERGTALLVCVRGPNIGARFLLDRDVVTVGRHPDSDIFLDDITVSRRHAEFRRAGDTFTVVDAGSLNGSYVNGSRRDEQALATGDEVQIGRFKLRAFIAEAG